MAELVDGLDRFQRRHPVLGLPLAVVYKFFDDQGNFLAAIITYYAFIAIFPLLLIGYSILGFVLQGNEGLQDTIFDSALRQFPIIGNKFQQPDGLQGSTPAVVVGTVAALYGALGLGQASQNLMNIAWSVPRNSRPNPFLARLRSLLLLAMAGLAVLAATLLTALRSNAGMFGADLDATLQLVIVLGTIALNAFVFMLLFRLATARKHSLRAAAPGALAVALMWQGLQYAGAVYVEHVIGTADDVNGTFALVLGLVALIYIAAVMAVLGVEINVVRTKRLYPRALLTPFTDNVDLTRADRRAYADYAKSMRHKGFETIRVRFHDRT
ncbi:MAG: YihY/virulence factor BrkB family protein [Nocardioidaceae bacterium]